MKMQSSEEWYKTQVEVHGMIKKPHHYRVGQRRAIDRFFTCRFPLFSSILDVGCGEGTGIQHLRSSGYLKVTGIEVNPLKAELARRRWSDVITGDFETYQFDRQFDILWMSHCFEHMRDPTKATHKMLELLSPNGCVFMIMPYPDTGDRLAHCASETIGLRKRDAGSTVRRWFELRGFDIINLRFDDFREKEIWLRMTPK